MVVYFIKGIKVIAFIKQVKPISKDTNSAASLPSFLFPDSTDMCPMHL